MKKEPKKIKVESLFYESSTWQDVERLALTALETGLPPEIADEGSERMADTEKSVFAHGVLRWALSSRPQARLQWEAQGDQGSQIADRDRFVRQLWEAIESGAIPELKDTLVQQGVLEAYRRRLFAWFLIRFRLSDAVSLFTSRSKFIAAVWVMAFGIVAVLAAAPLGSHKPQATALLVAGIGLAVTLVGGVVSGLPRWAFLHALFPRLGAAVGLGYLFLLGAPGLVGLMLAWEKPWQLRCAFVLGLAILLAAYVAVHIRKHVVPLPRGWDLFRRSSVVCGLGAGYSLLGLAFSAPILFSQGFLKPAGEAAKALPIAPTPSQMALCAAVALSLGVVLELALEDRPMAEPL